MLREKLAIYCVICRNLRVRLAIYWVICHNLRVFRCKFYSPKKFPVKKMTNMRYAFPFMAKTILNFHFDFLKPSLNSPTSASISCQSEVGQPAAKQELSSLLLCFPSQNHCRSSPLFKSQQPQQPRRSQHQLPQPTLTARIPAGNRLVLKGVLQKISAKVGILDQQPSKGE